MNSFAPRLLLSACTVLREHYLRSDIPCGSLACSQCENAYTNSAAPILALASGDAQRPTRSATVPMLSREGRAALGEAIGRHYIVLDTNIVLHQVRFAASCGRLEQLHISHRWMSSSQHTLAQMSSSCRPYWTRFGIARYRSSTASILYLPIPNVASGPFPTKRARAYTRKRLRQC